MSDDAMKKMLQRAREMQEKQNRRLADTLVQASAAGGKVRGRMNGHRALLQVQVDRDLVRAENREALEGYVVELVNDLIDQIDKVLEERFGIVDKMPSLSTEHLFGKR
ncbi:MAG TPA: YbaB/EbfC family nucleoid-associated protein [Thermoanaerobaculia bacterium]|jgi:hypothetical protein